MAPELIYVDQSERHWGEDAPLVRVTKRHIYVMTDRAREAVLRGDVPGVQLDGTTLTKTRSENEGELTWVSTSTVEPAVVPDCDVTVIDLRTDD